MSKWQMLGMLMAAICFSASALVPTTDMPNTTDSGVTYPFQNGMPKDIDTTLLLVLDYMYRNKPVWQGLKAIAFAAGPYQAEGGRVAELQRILSGAAGYFLPQLLANKNTKDIVAIIEDEMVKDDTFVGLNLKNATDSQILSAVLQRSNYARMLQRILMRGSARDIIPSDPSVTPKCYDDTMDFLDSLVVQQPWSQWSTAMFDAWGKPTGGIERGHLYFVGSYDECMLVEAHIPGNITLGNRTRTRPNDFRTHFCRATVAVPKSFVESLHVNTRGVELKVTWGACMPNSCTGNDVKTLIEHSPLARLNLPLEKVYCENEPDLNSDTSAIIAIFVLAFTTFLVIAGTLLDVCTRQFKPSGKLPSVNNTKTGRYAFKNKAFEALETTAIEVQMPNGQKASTANPEENGITVANGDKPQIAVSMTTQTSTPTKRRESLPEKLLKSFSVYINIPRVLAAKRSPGNIDCLHGIRFISMSWIILGHTFNYGVLSNVEMPTSANILDATKIMTRFTFMGIYSAPVGVDTFFLLSGLLVGWLTLKQLDKSRWTPGSLVYYYIHRYWRLTPMYVMIIMIFACLYPYMGHGPLWPEHMIEGDACKTEVWTNLLYVNNLVDVDKPCMSWTWYLANDMQFYIIAPIFITVTHLFLPAGCIMTFLLMCLGITMAAVQEHHYGGNLLSGHTDGYAYFNNVYITPWCRVAAYAIGLMLGTVLWKRKRASFNVVLATIGWLLSIAVALFIIYIPYTEMKEGGTPWTRNIRTSYESLKRPFWSLCVGFVIFACHNYRGGIINSFLSWKGFIPLSRLTYAAYLIHPIVMVAYVYSKRSLLVLDDYELIYMYFAHLVMSYLASFLLSVTLESPAMAMEKAVRGHSAH